MAGVPAELDEAARVKLLGPPEEDVEDAGEGSEEPPTTVEDPEEDPQEDPEEEPAFVEGPGLQPVGGAVFPDSRSLINDVSIAPDRGAVPGVRPPPILEIGDPFQGQGTVNQGFELPTGALWNPSLLVYGTFRSALQATDNGARDGDQSEWANRLDVFVNLRLSGTERIVLGMRPLDETSRGFTGWRFSPRDGSHGGHEAFNGNIELLFFEGDFGEIFPKLDRADDSQLDIGFSVGRQAIFIQNGVMVDGIMDAVGITRNSLRFWGASNVRITGIYATPDVLEAQRNNAGTANSPDYRDIVIVNTEWDYAFSTIEADVAWVNSRKPHGQGLFIGLAGTQRFGKFNTVLRYNTSIPLDDGVGDVNMGHLFTAEVSHDIGGNDNLISSNFVYANGFVAVDNYQSAYRGRRANGTLGRIGILYASPNIGRAGSALSNATSRAVGGAAGVQLFFNNNRTNVVVEAGGRTSTQDGVTAGAMAAGFRVQQAIHRHIILQSDAFVGKQERMQEAWGARFEIQIQF